MADSSTAGPGMIGTTQVKRSLNHFAIGKLVSSLLGVMLLLLLVRALPRADYGAYIVLLALFEICQLGTNLGSFSMVFRYVPELRAKGARRELSEFVRWLLRFRIATLAIAAVALALAAGPISRLIGVEAYESVVRLYGWVILFEGLTRFVDLTFDSLLMQGAAQISIVIRSSLRVMGLLLLLLTSQGEVRISQWVMVEIVASACGVLACFLMINRYVHAGASTQAAEEGHRIGWRRIVRYSTPSYVAQLLSLVSGADTIKLIVSRVAGVVETAAFGFAAVLAMTIQRYMPAFLLIGMVRPLFVSARTQGKSSDELVYLAGTVLKLNVLAMGPIVAALVVGGPAIVTALTAGKLPDSIVYVHFFMGFMFLQILHAVIGLIGIAVEEAAGSLYGTALGLVGLGIGVAAYPLVGIVGLCCGLLLGEFAWSVAMTIALRRKHGIRLRWPLGGLAKMVAALAGVAVPSWLLLHWVFADGHWAAWGLAILAAVGFLVVAALIKPFEPREREQINKLLPKRVFVW